MLCHLNRSLIRTYGFFKGNTSIFTRNRTYSERLLELPNRKHTLWDIHPSLAQAVG